MLFRKKILGTVAYMGGLQTNLEAFTWSWGQMIQYNNEYVVDHSKGELIHMEKARVSLHDYARNSLVEIFLGDWLFMTDTDHRFEPDIVGRMLRVMNKFSLDVATGLYRHRASPGGPVLYNWDSNVVLAIPIGDWDRSAEALRVGSAGAGCLLVRRTVFDRIASELGEKPFDRYPRMGEDHSFAKRCHTLGIPFYGLMKIESPHIVVETLEMKDHDPHVLPLDYHETAGFK